MISLSRTEAASETDAEILETDEGECERWMSELAVAPPSSSNASSSNVMRSGSEESSAAEVGAVEMGRLTSSLDTQSCQPTWRATAPGAPGRMKSVVSTLRATSTLMSSSASDSACSSDRAPA